LADATGLKRGDHVVAIGAPLAIQNTLSDGIVTNLLAIGDVNVIQTSAPISHGSSGGPLFDDRGAVLGITSATNPSGELVNFAISSLYLRQLLQNLAPVGIADFLAQTKVVVPILRGSVSVLPRKAIQFQFSVPPNQAAVIEGAFSISGGAGNDIYWRLVQVPPSGQPVETIPMARYSSQSAIKRNLQTGSYALIFDNGFSMFSGKTITGNVSLTYFR
jgi:S1-C subfamily serine protease